MDRIKNVFIDTNIFEAQRYHFGGPKLSALAELLSSNSVRLLLPEIIESEILRHMRERAAESLNESFTASQLADSPFLKGQKWWPVPWIPKSAKKEFVEKMSSRCRDIAKEFFGRFQTLILSNATADIRLICLWYDQKLPPFGDKRDKKSEFPDAIALSIISNYAIESRQPVAVVSADRLVGEFCKNSTNYLVHFLTIEELAENLIQNPTLIDQRKAAILENTVPIDLALRELLGFTTIYSKSITTMDIIEEAFGNIDIKDVKLLGVGKFGTVVSFNAVVNYRRKLRYIDNINVGGSFFPPPYMPEETGKVGIFEGKIEVPCTMKIFQDPDKPTYEVQNIQPAQWMFAMEDWPYAESEVVESERF